MATIAITLIMRWGSVTEPDPVTQRLPSLAWGLHVIKSDVALADRAHWELAASPAPRQDRITAVISHESEGQLWVVSPSFSVKQ